jgi:dienelactone hydrolase
VGGLCRVFAGSDAGSEAGPDPLFFGACVPAAEFGSLWPPDVPVQIHGMDGDKWFVEEGDLAAARELVVSARNAQLYLYPGNRHLFADNSLPSYDEGAAELLIERVILFLDAVD